MIKRHLLVFMAVLLCMAKPTPLLAQDDLTPAQIDHLIRAEWKRSAVAPAPPADDAHYLRRVTLDVLGTLPTAEEVKAFLANRSPYKRHEALVQLLNSPKYAEYWTAYWDDVLMGRQVRRQVVDRGVFREWLKGQVSTNTPYNKFVYELLTASGVNTNRTVAKPVNGVMPQMDMDANGKTIADSRVNGAVNWYMKYADTPADYSGAVSRLFMGVQIQCAQCHDHKTEAWKQSDFRKFTSCFMQAQVRPVNRVVEKGMSRQLELTDSTKPIRIPPRLMAKMKENGRFEYAAAEPSALDGTSFANEPNKRQAIAKWITAPQNPWFASAIVNRMWAHFLGRGFVNPIDDFRESNPVVMPELLKKLADDFTAHGYDLKYLVKLICSTQVYQLSSQPAKSADEGNTLWARYRLKPVKPEVMMDMLVTATNMESMLERVAGNRLPALKMALQRQLTFLFDVDEEFEQKDYEGTIPQALLLLNGSVANSAVSLIPGAALTEVMALPGSDSEKVESLYLRTVSRLPSKKEIAYWSKFVNTPRAIAQTFTPPTGQERSRLAGSGEGVEQNLQEKTARQERRTGGADPLGRIAGRFAQRTGTPKQQAYEDMFWALLNSSEFIFNH